MSTNIFIAFAKEDLDVRDKLLRQMNLVKDREGWDIWASHEIKAGSDWSAEIKQRLSGSEVVILLMSSSFFNSPYILNTELPAMIAKHKGGNCHIIPVIARHCLWKDTAFGEYAELGDIQALPSGERPIVSRGIWDSEEEPYVETVTGIKSSIRAYRQKKEQAVAEELARKQREKEEAARAKAEGAAHDKAKQDNTEQGWENFLKKYPESIFYPEAQKKLDTLRKARLDEQKRRDREAEAARKEQERLAAQQRAEREAAAKRAAAETAWQQEQQRQRDETARKEREEEARRKKEEAARKRRELEATRQRQEQAKASVSTQTYRPSAPTTYSSTSSRLTSFSWILILGALGVAFWFIYKSCSEKGPQETTLDKPNVVLVDTTATSAQKHIQKSGFEMVEVEGGTFMMGSPENENGREQSFPYMECQHRVTVRPFKIGKFEVTQADWKEIMGYNPSNYNYNNCSDCPVEVVSWNEIQTFLKKLNSQTGKKYRLPTEAEWEFAARGGNKSQMYKFSGSNDYTTVAWVDKNSGSVPHPVGTKAPNELGLFDMSGNIEELCGDIAKLYPCDSRANYTFTPYKSKPVCSRGGTFVSSWYNVRVANRNDKERDFKDWTLGFRLAHD